MIYFYGGSLWILQIGNVYPRDPQGFVEMDGPKHRKWTNLVHSCRPSLASWKNAVLLFECLLLLVVLVQIWNAYTAIHVYIYIYTHTCTYKWICMCLYNCNYIFIHLYSHIVKCIYLFFCMCVCVCVCVCLHICLYMYVYEFLRAMCVCVVVNATLSYTCFNHLGGWASNRLSEF